MKYRHHNRGGIDFAPERKRRIHNDVISEYVEEAIEDHLDIAELICPLCKKHLIHEDDLFHCYWCGLTTEVVLVVDRLVSDDDPRRLSLRLLQRKGTLTLKAWFHAGENDGFFFSFLPCPWCKDPITHLIEHDTGVRTSCCNIAFIPQIIEIPTPKPPRGKLIQRWKVSYHFEKVGISHPTLCELKLIERHAYISELAHFLPKCETPIEVDSAPADETQDQKPRKKPPSTTSDETHVSKAKTIPVRNTDAITLFLRTFIIRKPNAITPRNDVYEAYVHWIRKHNQQPLSNKVFYRHLEEILRYVGSGQNRINGKLTRCYRGVKLRSNDDMLSE